MKQHQEREPREIELIDPSYQPSKAELEEELRIDATFEELSKAVVQPVKVTYVMPPSAHADQGILGNFVYNPQTKAAPRAGAVRS
ncbi:MAG: hypothetical protein F4X77_16205 [Acidobacteriia bacterium]|nr:hypothetical protein [Terriglobia bacterium]